MSLTQSVPLEPIAYARFLQIYRWVSFASARGGEFGVNVNVNVNNHEFDPVGAHEWA